MAFLRIMAVLGLDGRGFSSGIRKAEKEAEGIAKSIRGHFLGAFSIAFATAAAKRVIDWASAIRDMSQRIGISAEKFQEWSAAAELSSASMEDVIRGVETLGRTASEALSDPASESAKAFKELGISAEELKSLGLERLFVRVGDAVRDGGGSMKEMDAQMTVLGKSAGKLRVAFSEGLDALSEGARRRGLIVDEESIRIVELYGDKWAEVGKKATAAGTQAIKWTAQLHETITVLGQNMGDFFSSIGRFFTDDTLPRNWKQRLDEVSTEYRARRYGRQMQMNEDFFGERRLEIRPGQSPGGITDEETARRRAEARQNRLEAMQEAFFEEEKFFYDLENKQALEALKNRKDMETKANLESDALARIGGFVGGTSRIATLQERQERHLSEVARHTRRLAERGVKLQNEP